jgi:Phosphodiester glycosidase
LHLWIRRHKKLSALVVVGVLLSPVWWSLGSALSDPALGSTVPGRLAEWTRGHGGDSFVSWIENQWYSHHQPPIGGKPAKRSIPGFASSATHLKPATTPAASAKTPTHLPPPPPISPITTTALQGEGQWHPVGRSAAGVPAVYETFVRPDAIHTSEVTGIAWMDTTLLRAALYSGSTIPGGGPWQQTAPISPSAANSLVAAFNSGFRMSNAQGGYFTEGRTVLPLRQGAASFVIYSNGTATVGAWGRDVTMGPNVVAVRQNLDLIVDGGQPVAGLSSSDNQRWGSTLGGAVYVWRSAVGVTPDGALVYVGGPGLDITDLASVLVRAGAARAMELDINTDWVNLATYAPPSPSGAATPTNGTDLLPNMVGTPSRYFESWWSRDFITMSIR